MEFRRKTKALHQPPLGFYVVLILLLVSLFWTTFHNTSNKKQTSVEADIPSIETEEQIEDNIKPDIYIPEATVIAHEDSIPSSAPKSEIAQKTTVEETPKEEIKILKKEEPIKNSDPKKTKIGSERKLTSFVPGTMGAAGTLPSHNCKAKGELIMFITIDESGKVISAGRSSGVTDPCAITAAVIWLKQYVKANKKPNETSTGIYTLKF